MRHSSCGLGAFGCAFVTLGGQLVTVDEKESPGFSWKRADERLILKVAKKRGSLIVQREMWCWSCIKFLWPSKKKTLVLPLSAVHFVTLMKQTKKLKKKCWLVGWLWNTTCLKKYFVFIYLSHPYERRPKGIAFGFPFFFFFLDLNVPIQHVLPNLMIQTPCDDSVIQVKSQTLWDVQWLHQ